MKQTNGAVTLLLSAFKSIYRNAYVKGIASAVILTAGLAAGQANAAAFSGGESLAEPTDIVIEESGTYDSFTIEADNTNGDNISSVTITSGDKTANYVSGATFTADAPFTIESGTGLTVSADATDTSGGALKVSELNVHGELDITAVTDKGSASAEAATISITDETEDAAAKVTLTGINSTYTATLGVEDNTGTTDKNEASVITLGQGGELAFAGAAAGSALVKGASLTVSDGGKITLANTKHGTIETDSFSLDAKSTIANSGSLVFASDAVTINGTVDNAKDITFSGHTVDVSSDKFNTASGGKVTFELSNVDADGKPSIDAWADGYVAGKANLSGYIKVDGTMEIKKGIVTVANGTHLYSTTDASSAAGTIEVNGNYDTSTSGLSTDGDKATLKISSADLADFLTPEETELTLPLEEGQDEATKATLKDGALYVKSGGILEFTDAVTLSDFAFTGTATNSGSINIVDDEGYVVFKATDMTIESKLASGATALSTADQVVLQVANLTLGSSELKTADSASITYKEAQISNSLNFDIENGQNAKFQVAATNNLIAKDTVDGKDVAGTGTIGGADAVIVSSGTIDVQAGNWTASNNLSVSGGSLKVTAETGSVDATLTLDKALTLDLGTTSSAVTVTGITSGNAEYDPEATGAVLAQLDLSNGLKSNGTGNDAEVKATSGGIIVLDALDVKTLTAATGTNGVKLIAEKGGKFEIDGALSVDIDDFGTAVKQVNISENGYLEASAVTLTHVDPNGDTELKDAANNSYTGTALDLGTGTLRTAAFSIADNTKVTVANPDKTAENKFLLQTYDTATLAKGNVEVSESLTVGNKNFVIGDGSSTAKVTLETETPAGTGTVTVGSTEGDVQVKSAATLEVLNGSWDASGVTFDVAGTLTIGDAASDPEDYAPVLTAAGIKTANGSTVTVNENGKATFTTADLDSNVTVNGALTLVGDTTANVDDDAKTADNGIVFGTNGKLTVSNSGSLDLQEAAAAAFVTKAVAATDDTVTVADGYKNRIDVSGGSVRVDLGADSTLNAKALADLKDKLFASGNVGDDGLLQNGSFLNVGAAKLDSLEFEAFNGGEMISWDKLSDFADTSSDTTNDSLINAMVYDVSSTDNVLGQIGSLRAERNTTAINIAGNTSLNNAALNGGMFASNAAGSEVVDLVVASDKKLTLNGSGEAGRIDLAQDSVLETNAGNGGLIEVTDVRGGTDSTQEHNSGAFEAEDVTLGALYVNGGSYSATGTVEVKDFIFETDTTFSAKTLKLTGTAVDDALFRGNAEVETLDASTSAQNLAIYSGTVVAGEAVLANNTQYVFVGTDGDEAEKLASQPGYLQIGTADLNGATVYVDPAYGEATSLAAIGSFKDKVETSPAATDLGIMNGNIIVGKNAAVGFGTDLEGLAAVIAKYQTNGSLSEDGFGSILAINGSLHIQNGNYVIVNGDSTVSEVADQVALRGDEYAYTDANGVARTATDVDMVLGKSSALLITDDSFTDKEGNKALAAITFDRTNASVGVDAEGSDIVLDGSFKVGDNLKIFADQDSNPGDTVDDTGVTVAGGDITVTSLNGVIHGLIEAGENKGTVTLEFNEDEARNALRGASNPVYQYLRSYAYGKVNPDAPADVLNTPANTLYSDANISVAAWNAMTAEEQDKLEAEGYGLVGTAEDGVYRKVAQSDFLDEVLYNGNGSDAESVARLAVYGGAAEVALAASSVTSDAIASRMGMGNPNGNLVMADNEKGAGLWLAPVYKNHESDDFDAEGVNYGVDLDLTGVALGADYTFGSNVRGGAMFAVGSGDADGQGAGSAVSNDFDFWSVGVYGGYAYEAFSLTADLSWTQVDNDIDANTAAAGKVSASMDADVLSAGLTAKYDFDLDMVKVAPHLGMRYTSIDIDDYSVSDIASSDVDSISVFSIPVGVMFSTDIATASGWNVKPALDLTLTVNTGDDEVDSDVRFSGVDMTTDLTSEFIDNVTYGATVGVQVQKDAFQFGLGVNYTGVKEILCKPLTSDH